MAGKTMGIIYGGKLLLQMSTFYDILHDVKWQDVLNSLQKHYFSKYPEHNPDDYKDAFEEMKTLKSIKNDNFSIMKVWSYEETWPEDDELEPEIMYDVCIDCPDSEYDTVSCMSLKSWSEFLPLIIHREVGMSDADVVAHVLWEATWFGFHTEEWNFEIEKMFNDIQDVINITDGSGISLN